jgi:CheY-like chemotaxis protein
MVGGQTILVVDDDASVRDIFQRSLERAGFHVLTAAHGKEALALFGHGGVSIVLTDILMPELDGFQLIYALKKEAPSIRIIAMSVMNDLASYRDVILGLGAELAVCKPVYPHDLVKLVREFIATPICDLQRPQ